MSSDYFLIHRALQLQKLMSEGNVEVPGRFSRDGYSSGVVDLWRNLDRIAKMPLGNDAQQGVVSWVASLGSASKQKLTDRQRVAIDDLERQLVTLKLRDDPHGPAIADGVMTALLGDRGFFDGLKPLAQHSDHFPYEMLYPTWFNLYTAMTVRLSGDPRSSLSDETVLATFQTLQEFESSQGASPQLVGMMTLLANRFDAAEAARLLERLGELMKASKPEDMSARIDRFAEYSNACESASDYCELLKSLVIVEACQADAAAPRKKPPASAGTFPANLAKHLQALADDDGQFEAYHRLIVETGQVVDAAGGFHPDLAACFPSDADSAQLVQVCLPESPPPAALTLAAQSAVARALRQEHAAGNADRQPVIDFARRIAARLGAAEDSTVDRFAAEFLEKPANRKIVLGAAAGEEKRNELAQKLYAAAQSASDPGRLLHLTLLAATIGTEYSVEELEKIQLAITVLGVCKKDESISRRELDQLIDDVRAHLPESSRYLAAPAFAGRGKSDRMARLYLTLNEACHSFVAIGRAGNFGLTRAAFRNLDRLAED